MKVNLLNSNIASVPWMYRHESSTIPFLIWGRYRRSWFKTLMTVSSNSIVRKWMVPTQLVFYLCYSLKFINFPFDTTPWPPVAAKIFSKISGATSSRGRSASEYYDLAKLLLFVEPFITALSALFKCPSHAWEQFPIEVAVIVHLSKAFDNNTYPHNLVITI